MPKSPTVRPVWLVLIVLVSLGAKGCPATVGCGVSGSLATSPRGFSADTWNCQVGMQLAKGATVMTPQQARTDLLAKKDMASVQVAGLSERLKGGGDQAFGFGGNNTGADAGQVKAQLQVATKELEQAGAQVESLDRLQPPPGSTVLSEGAWSLRDGRPLFSTHAPYEPGKNYVIPYVVRSEQGEVVDMGYLAVESVQVESRP